MSTVTKTFNKYDLQYFTNNGVEVARFGLRQDATEVGYVSFVKDGAPLPANSMGGSPSLIYLYYEASRLNDFIYTLRKEKSLTMSFDASKKLGLIAASAMVGTE